MDQALQNKLYNEQAERCVLGLSLRGSASELIKLDEKDFGSPQNRLIFKAIAEMFTEGSVIDPLTVSEHLESKNVLKACGGLSYLVKLEDELFLTSNFDEYVKVLKEKAGARELYKTSKNIEKMLTDGSTVKEITGTLLRDLTEANDASETGLVLIRDLINETLNLISTPEDQRKTVLTGFPTLDKMLGGLKPQTMHVISGRAGMGKTAFALNVAFNMARRGSKVAFFSLEMSDIEVTLRLLSSLSGYSTNELQSHFGTRHIDTNRVLDAIEQLYELDLHVDATGIITTQDILSKCKTIKATKGLDVVIVDYLNLLKPVNSNANRVNEVSEITRHLKLMSKDLDVPVIALTQTNRGVEHRDDKRPSLADLRESGSIEQDADSVIFLYRESYYNDQAIPQAIEEAEILVRKNRHGKTGIVPVLWRSETTTFIEKATIDEYRSSLIDVSEQGDGIEP